MNREIKKMREMVEAMKRDVSRIDGLLAWIDIRRETWERSVQTWDQRLEKFFARS